MVYGHIPWQTVNTYQRRRIELFEDFKCWPEMWVPKLHIRHPKKSMTGWWFGTCLFLHILSEIGNTHPNWRTPIFQRGRFSTKKSIKIHQNPSTSIKTHQNPSNPIKTHQNPSNTHQTPKENPWKQTSVSSKALCFPSRTCLPGGDTLTGDNSNRESVRIWMPGNGWFLQGENKGFLYLYYNSIVS